MNNTLKKQCKVNPGTVIKGKWHHHSYTIIKELGYGANGIVYLAQNQHNQVALKMSDNSFSITSEVNVLKSFAKVQGSFLGPSLLDVDDWETNSGKVSFYVMEYIKGPNFLTFIQQKGHSWVSVTILQLLSDLQTLHENGWVFGDLKPENLIVTGPPPRVRCIDVGGTTIQGRAIKEFTEFYDRGYWGLGSRRAEPTYDLFSVAMIIMNTAYPNRFNKVGGGTGQLREMIRKKTDLLPFERLLMNAFTGTYNSANDMRQDLLQIVNNQSTRSLRNKPRTTGTQTRTRKRQNNNGAANSRVTQGPRTKKGSLVETLFIFIIVSLLYIIYIIELL